MEWDFTAEDVVKGDALYGLREFRDDLAQELRMNLGPASEEELRRAFLLTYDLCYWLATGKPFEEFLDGLAEDPAAIRMAKMVKEPMERNVEMLGAILQRLIMDRVEAGMPLESALAAVDAHHRELVANELAPGHA
ncbi:MAG: hypothetical protein Fur0039_26850 [Rhodocyclaceae bacterium]